MFVDVVVPSWQPEAGVSRAKAAKAAMEARGFIAASRIDLVDVDTLEPALQVIDRSLGGDGIRRLCNDRVMYVSPDEIIAWGEQNGHTFLPRQSVPAAWRRYITSLAWADRALNALEEASSQLSDDDLSVVGRLIEHGAARRSASIQADREWHTAVAADYQGKQGADAPRPSGEPATEAPLPQEGDSVVSMLAKQALEDQAALISGRAEIERLTAENQRLRAGAAALEVLAKDALRVQSRDERKSRGRRKGALKRELSFLHVGEPGGAGLSQVEGFATVVDESALVSQSNIIPMRAVPGIYFLLNARRKVVYVGQSTNLMARLGTHVGDASKVFDSAIVVHVPRENLTEVEMKYIDAYQPVYNRTGVRGTRLKRAGRARSMVKWLEREACQPQRSRRQPDSGDKPA